MIVSRRPDRLSLLVVILLLTATAAYRISFVPDARLAGDEAAQYAAAKHVADLKMFPVTGVAMTGDAVRTPGGLYHLIMSVPFFFSDDPQAAGIYLVLLNIAALFLGFLIFTREFGLTAAFAVLILSLFNPFAVFFADRQWNPNLLVPLGYIWIWLLLSAFRGQGRFRWGWLAALLVVSPQIHMSCPHLTLLTVAMMVLWRPKVRWAHLIAGTGIGFATYLPYFVVDGLEGWNNTTRIMARLSEAAAPWYEAFRSGFYQILYAAGDYTYFIGKGFWFPMTEWGLLSKGGLLKYADLAGIPSWYGYLAAGLVIVALLISVAAHIFLPLSVARGWIKGFTAEVRNRPLQTLAVINIPILILLMLNTSKPFYPHYSMVLFPLAMVPVAAVASKLRGRLPVTALFVLVSAIALNQAIMTGRYYRTEESKCSVHLVMEATKTIVQDAGPSSFRLIHDMPGTRMGTWPYSVIAREYLKTAWRETRGNTRLTYVVAPAGSRHEKQAAKIWEIDDKILIRREEPR